MAENPVIDSGHEYITAEGDESHQKYAISGDVPSTVNIEAAPSNMKDNTPDTVIEIDNAKNKAPSKVEKSFIVHTFQSLINDKNYEDIFLELLMEAKPVFKDGIAGFKADIKKAKKTADRRQSIRFKQCGYEYDISVYKLVNFFLDFGNWLVYSIIYWGKETPYVNAFYRFLQCNACHLVNETPYKFVYAFGSFFDKFLRKALTRKLTFFKTKTKAQEDHQLKRNAVLRVLLPEISVKNFLEDFYRENNERYPPWDSFTDLVDEYINLRFDRFCSQVNNKFQARRQAKTIETSPVTTY